MMISGYAANDWRYPGIQGPLLVSAPIPTTVLAPGPSQPSPLAIPDQRSILRAELYTQGGSLDASNGVHLANANDIDIDIDVGDFAR